MSQAKVDKYKQEKANRQQIMRKEKRVRLACWLSAGSVFLHIISFMYR